VRKQGAHAAAADVGAVLAELRASYEAARA
jgi:hypothetical protein